MFRTPLVVVIAAACLLAAGCGGGGSEEVPQLNLSPAEPLPVSPAPPPPVTPTPPPGVEETSPPLRVWWLRELDAYGEETSLADNLAEGGVYTGVDETRIAGGVPIVPTGYDANADVEVFSNESGKTYWVSAEAPLGSTSALGASAFGGLAQLFQVHEYRKGSDDATLQLVISALDLQVIDYSDRFTHPGVCPWIPLGTLDHPRCFDQVSALVEMDVLVQDLGRKGETCPQDPGSSSCRIVDWHAGAAQIAGYNSRWTWAPGFVSSFRTRNGTSPPSSRIAKPIFRSTDFSSSLGFVPDIITAGQDGRLTLARDVIVNIDLSQIPTEHEFNVLVFVRARAHNRQAREAYARAMLRDPVRTSGVQAITTGLVELQPSKTPPAVGTPALPACHDPVGQSYSGGGSVQFSSDGYTVPEFELGYETIFLERVGGTAGTQIVTVNSMDGTAVAGSEYDSFRQDIVFHDGDDVRRAIQVPTRNDSRANGDSSLTLQLSAQDNCGRIGARRSAVVTIVDDDQRPGSGGGTPPARVTVGGEVTGLVGTGLVLEDRANFVDVAVPANGTYVFARDYPSGSAYDVHVRTNPANPAQVCTVSNGAGTSAGTSITNVNVSCATPAPVGSLDPTFGTAGKATSSLVGGADQIELQSDGRIVALSGTILSRYLPDGSVDTGFGNAGRVTVSFADAPSILVNSFTLQPDDRILVTGSIRRTAVDQDIAVARYLADGSVDTGFGTAGTAVLVNADNFEQGAKALVQTDGRIVVAANWDVPPAGQRSHNDFAVMRFNADGSVDTAFGTGGRTTVNVAGRTDIVTAAVLQSDGRIVLAGRVADGGGANPDLGMVRFDADGSVDTTFASNGVLRRDISGRGEWDEPEGIVVQPDGRLVVVLQSRFDPTVPYPFSLARFEPTGALDTTFGTNGVVITPIGTGNALTREVALQGDGRIVVVGQVASATVNDFGIARYLANGSLDAGFDDDGILLLDFFAANDAATDVAIQRDRRIVVAGTALNGSAFGLAMVRVMP